MSPAVLRHLVLPTLNSFLAFVLMSSSFCVQVVFLLMHNFNGIQGNLAGFWFAALIAAFWYTATYPRQCRPFSRH